MDQSIAAVASGVPTDIEAGIELAALAEAMTTRPDAEPRPEREALIGAVGKEATERAIGVCATYQMMNRLLDAVGAPTPPPFLPLAQDLGFQAGDISR